MIYFILHILFLLIFIFLSINTAYILFLSLVGHLKKSSGNTSITKQNRFAILITSFKEDDVIVNTVSSATQHNYPEPLFDVYVAADHLKPATIAKLKLYRASIHEVNFEVGSKARSLNYLLNLIDERKYDYAVILDGDNIMMDGFLTLINHELQLEKIAVQGHRSAKNLNSSIAVLDALSEEVNNHIFRKAPSNIGLSSSLIGSGMAFPFGVLKSVYNKPGIIDNPACDREVDFEMLVHDLKIKYVPNAYVLDEKVAAKDVYTNQRRRWLESQLMHIALFFSDWKRVKEKSADFWNKLFIQLIPPRLLMFGFYAIILALVAAGFLTGNNFTGISYSYWIIIFILYIVALLIAIPRRFLNRATANAFFHLPMLFFSLLKATIGIKVNRKEFVHTPKSFTGDSASTDQRK